MTNLNFFALEMPPSEEQVKNVLEPGFNATLVECEQWPHNAHVSMHTEDEVELSAILRFNDQRGYPDDFLNSWGYTIQPGELYMRALFTRSDNCAPDLPVGISLRTSGGVSTYQVRLLFGDMLPLRGKGGKKFERIHDWSFRCMGDVSVKRELSQPPDFSRRTTMFSHYKNQFRERVAKGLYFMGVPIETAFELAKVEEDSSQFKLEWMLTRRDAWEQQRRELVSA